MACKIIKETEIPGAVLPSEFDETGTVTMTLIVDNGVWETKEHMNGKFWIVEHDSKREAEKYYAMKVNEYRACTAWAAQFD
jgi:hypothetical protein